MYLHCHKNKHPTKRCM